MIFADVGVALAGFSGIALALSSRGEALDGLLRLALGAYVEDLVAVLAERRHEVERVPEQADSPLQVDDVNAVFFHKNVLTHFTIIYLRINHNEKRSKKKKFRITFKT